jgi:hypothetical protein
MVLEAEPYRVDNKYVWDPVFNHKTTNTKNGSVKQEGYSICTEV